MTANDLPMLDAAILTRVVAPAAPTLPEGAARALLDLRFAENDLARMDELAEKNRADELTDEERLELASFLRIGHFLDLIQAKALASLKSA
jgi:hypothetical protein